MFMNKPTYFGISVLLYIKFLPLSPPFSVGVSPSKQRIFSFRSKIFPLRVDPILIGHPCPGKQTVFQKLFLFVKATKKDGDVLIYL